MSGTAWIPLAVEPDGPEIVRISSATCPQNVANRPQKIANCPQKIADLSHRAQVFVCIVRWFFYVDAHFTGPKTGLTEADVHEIVRWPFEKSLVEAMCDPYIKWLQRSADTTLTIVNYERWFSRSAKRRHLEARRQKLRRRADKTSAGERTKSVPTTTTTTTEENPPISPQKKRSKKAPTDPVEIARAAMKSDVLDTERFWAAWADWAAERAEQRKPLTRRAIQLQIAKLEGFGHDGAMDSIRQSLTNGWTGLFEVQAGRGGSARPPAPTRPQAPPGKFADDPDLITGSALDQVGRTDGG